ncbi:hypothetical protein HDU76_000339 [Blyttiomyces sp. JEL0837]|nr:hypothetical protein HDU76_000339 [Blyttiomyces sp. JEL0837]
MSSIVAFFALILLILGQLYNAVDASFLCPRALKNSFIQNIQTVNSNSGTTVTLVNTSLTQSYFGFYGGKLFYTKVPASVGQSGNFALTLTTSQPYTFVRGPNCTGDVVTCTGATIKSNDPDVFLNEVGFGAALFYTPSAQAEGPFVNTTSFSVGNIKSTHYVFVGYTHGVNFFAKSFGDGLFSLTNGNVAGDRYSQATSWLFNTGVAADKLQVGLYLPFYDKPNDYGELTLGGFDSSRFTGQITYCNTASFSNFNTTILTVDPLYDFVSMNDDCYQLVLDSFNPQVDPKTNALINDCGLLKTGPNVDLSFNGQVFTMVPESYIFQDTTSNVCVLLFANIPDNILIGAPFLVNYYSAVHTTSTITKTKTKTKTKTYTKRK